MLVNCPKCGFSQPKDRYCAKCGVDMENFTPKSPSVGKQILMHPALHISLIFVVVFVAVAYIKGHERKTFLEQVEKMPTGRAVIEATPTPSSEALPTPQEVAGGGGPATSAETPHASATPISVANATAPQAVRTGQLPTDAAPAGHALTTNGTLNPSAEDQKRATKVHVIYAEVDDLTLKKWIPEMQAAGQYAEADWRMGMLPNLEKRIAEDRSIVTLESVEKSFDGNRPSQEWFNGKSGDGQEFGLKTALSLREWDGSQVHGEIKITRVLDSSDLKVIESDLEAPPKAGWVIWKVLNPKAVVSRDLLEDTKSLFQIYKSARFKNERSDFTIFLVFDTPARR